MASLVLSTRLAVHKQSFSNLRRQNGSRVTKVHCLTLLFMLFFRLYSLRELDVYNKDEVLLASLFLVAEYLRNTNRVPNAIEVCKDVLFLLEHKTLGNINQTRVERFENVHSHPIKRGTKLLFTFRQVFARTVN